MMDLPENRIREIRSRFSLPFFIEKELYPSREESKGWRLGEFHKKEWARFILERQKIRILGPRDHIKTFFFGVAHPLQRLKYIPNDEIYIFSKTDKQAIKILDIIKNYIRVVPSLRFLGGEGSEFWNKTEIRCSTGATIYAQGFWSSIRGAHPRLIILDDVIDEDVIYSSEQNQKYIERYYSSIVPLAEPDTRTIIVGTLQREDDLYHSLDSEIYLLKTYDAEVDSEKKISLFPEKWNWDQLMAKKKEIIYYFGEQYYNKEYRNQPISFKGAVFKREDLKFYEKLPKDLEIYTGWDLAVSKKEDACYTAKATIGLDKEQNIYLADSYRARLSFPERLRAVKKSGEMDDPLVIAIEANTFQEDTVQELKRTTRLPIKGFKTTVNKLARFSALSVYFQNGKVFVRKDQKDFIAELLAFPRGTYTDQIDAFDFAVQASKQAAAVINEIHII